MAGVRAQYACVGWGREKRQEEAGDAFYGFNQHFLDAWSEVYRELKWKRQEPDVEELKCQQTYLLPPPACGSCGAVAELYPNTRLLRRG